MFNLSNSIIQELNIESLNKRGIRVLVKRDDLIHNEVSGNKWRKLKYNVELCKSRKKEGILTFGGAFSNHLLATAAACHKIGLQSIGLVRGNELNKNSNETLQNCSKLGMKLVFLPRSEYKLRYEKAFIESVSIDYPNYHIVPEGGANYHGMIGCQEILKEIEEEVDHVFVAQGTSTTSCGLAMALNENQTLHAVPVLKKYDSIGEMTNLFRGSGMDEESIKPMLQKVKVYDQYHFGGYGKYTEGLLLFINEFYKKHQLKLDPIYTGKVMFALLDIIQDQSFENSTVIFIHTGGLQGIKGIEKRSGYSFF